MIVLHRIFKSHDTTSKQMAKEMVPVYKRQTTDASKQGKWDLWLERARNSSN